MEHMSTGHGYGSLRGVAQHGSRGPQGRRQRPRSPSNGSDVEAISPKTATAVISQASKKRRSGGGAPGPMVAPGVNTLDSRTDNEDARRKRLARYGTSLEGRAAAEVDERQERQQQAQSWQKSIPSIPTGQGSPVNPAQFYGRNASRTSRHSLVTSQPALTIRDDDDDIESLINGKASSSRTTQLIPASDDEEGLVCADSPLGDADSFFDMTNDENQPPAASTRKGKERAREIFNHSTKASSSKQATGSSRVTRSSKSPEKPVTRGTAHHPHTVEEEEEEEEESIEQFDSLPKKDKPAASKSPAVDIRPKKRASMQTKDGTVQPVANKFFNQKPPPPKPIIQPTIKSIPALAEFGCVIDQALISLSSVTVGLEDLTIWRSQERSNSCTVKYDAIASFELCVDPERPCIRFEIGRRDPKMIGQLEDLCNGIMISPSPLHVLLALRPESDSQNAVVKLQLHCKAKHIQCTTVEQPGAQSLIDWQKNELGQANRRSNRTRGRNSSKHRDYEDVSDDEPQVTDPKGKGKAKVKEDPTQPKLTFKRQGPRQSARLSGQHDPDIEIRERESSVTPYKPKSPHLDKNEILFSYPLEGKPILDIIKGHRYRLRDHEFLDDTFLEFGLRESMSVLDVKNREAIHLFNTFFYDRISQKDRKNKPTVDHWPAYDSVKKWTKGTDIFEKDYIIVPINESFHWYLAIIVSPGRILRPDTDAEKDAESGTGPSPAPESRSEAHTPELAMNPRQERDFVDDLTSDVEDAPDKAEGIFGAENNLLDTSMDPLDIIGQSDDDDDMMTARSTSGEVGIAGGVRRLSLQPNEQQQQQPPRPQPIQSATLDLFNSQNNTGAKPTVPEPKPKIKPSRKDEDILKSDRAWILTFDSLGGTHKAVHNTLNRWLEYEARDKRKIDFKPTPARYLEAKVPQQPNSSDCGVFLIHYVKRLFEDPKATLEFIGRIQPPASAPERNAWEAEKNTVWKAGDTMKLRDDWTERIDELTARWRSIHGDAPAGQGGVGVSGDDDDEPIEAVEAVEQVEKVKYAEPVEAIEPIETAETENVQPGQRFLDEPRPEINGPVSQDSVVYSSQPTPILQPTFAVNEVDTLHEVGSAPGRMSSPMLGPSFSTTGEGASQDSVGQVGSGMDEDAGYDIVALVDASNPSTLESEPKTQSDVLPESNSSSSDSTYRQLSNAHGVVDRLYAAAQKFEGGPQPNLGPEEKGTRPTRFGALPDDRAASVAPSFPDADQEEGTAKSGEVADGEQGGEGSRAEVEESTDGDDLNEVEADVADAGSDSEHEPVGRIMQTAPRPGRRRSSSFHWRSPSPTPPPPPQLNARRGIGQGRYSGPGRTPTAGRQPLQSLPLSPDDEHDGEFEFYSAQLRNGTTTNHLDNDDDDHSTSLTPRRDTAQDFVSVDHDLGLDVDEHADPGLAQAQVQAIWYAPTRDDGPVASALGQGNRVGGSGREALGLTVRKKQSEDGEVEAIGFTVAGPSSVSKRGSAKASTTIRTRDTSIADYLTRTPTSAGASTAAEVSTDPRDTEMGHFDDSVGFHEPARRHSRTYKTHQKNERKRAVSGFNGRGEGAASGVGAKEMNGKRARRSEGGPRKSGGQSELDAIEIEDD